MATKAITDADFTEQVINASQPVLIDYWAEWCAPCKMIAPALEELSQTMQDKLTVGKVNIDENPEAPTKYGVRGIPTLMLFKDGEVLATKVGAMSKQQIMQWVESSLQA